MEKFNFDEPAHKILNMLIVIDILMVLYILFFKVPDYILRYVVIFDILLCIVLLLDFFIKLYSSKNRFNFFKYNILYLVSCIPFPIVLPYYFIAFRLLLIFRLLHLSGLIEKYFENFYHFLDTSGFDRILTYVLLVIIIFTFALYFLDPGLNLFDSLWFVVVTITTVGYGDITPTNHMSKEISLLLLLAGIFIFSTLTGAISSYFTDKVLNIDSDVEDGLEEVNEKIDNMEKELNAISQELRESRKENRELKEKLDELLER